MAAPLPFPAPSSPRPSRFAVWSPGTAPRPKPPSLLAHLRVKTGMAGLREREAYEYALWQSGKAPAGGSLVLQGLKVLGVLSVLAAILGMVWLQRLPAPAPQPRPESAAAKGMEVYFVFETEPGAQNEPLHLVGGRIGMKNDEHP